MPTSVPEHLDNSGEQYVRPRPCAKHPGWFCWAQAGHEQCRTDEEFEAAIASQEARRSVS